jgi:hypothetical protein
MAKKLSPEEFLNRHITETDTILSLFKKEKELRYSDLRKKIFFPVKSSQVQPALKHETQLIRILKGMCGASLLEKKNIGNKIFYCRHASNTVVEELIFRSKILRDSSYIKEMLESKLTLESQLESAKKRIYELNIEIGRFITENIELKEKLDQPSPHNS